MATLVNDLCGNFRKLKLEAPPEDCSEPGGGGESCLWMIHIPYERLASPHLMHKIFSVVVFPMGNLVD